MRQSERAHVHNQVASRTSHFIYCLVLVGIVYEKHMSLPETGG